MSPTRALHEPKPDASGVGSGAAQEGGLPSAAVATFDQKLAETQELVARLRGANERLASELSELKRQLSARVDAPISTVAGEPELSRLRREREEIRQRVLRMLQQLEDV